MSPTKRARDYSIDAAAPGLPPAKIARQIALLKIGDNEDFNDEMEGIEARDFTHLTKQDFDEAINEIEIDDRFLKIPEHITASAADRLPKQPTKALILYEKQPARSKLEEVTRKPEEQQKEAESDVMAE